MVPCILPSPREFAQRHRFPQVGKQDRKLQADLLPVPLTLPHLTGQTFKDAHHRFFAWHSSGCRARGKALRPSFPNLSEDLKLAMLCKVQCAC